MCLAEDAFKFTLTSGDAPSSTSVSSPESASFGSMPEDVTPISIPEDVARFEKLGVLGTLLKDRTTGKNIVWATDAYEVLSSAFNKRNEIFPRYITGKYAHVIKRRALKNKDEKSALTKKHAEVFTPSWIVKLMVDAADAAQVQNLKDDKNNGEHHSTKQTNIDQKQNIAEPFNLNID